MSKSDDLRRYRQNLEGELSGTLLYTAMAEAERQPQLSELYRRLAAIEAKHARFWQQKIGELSPQARPWRPGLRTRVLVWLAKRFGPGFVLPMVAATERESRSMYDGQPESAHTAMPREERSHARVLGRVLEPRHQGAGGNALRAAVLGSADGLVSNLSLVMGVAGARLSPRQIVAAGAAGLLSGACSMAIGEWISVQSSREFNERQIAIEADELTQAPEEEEEELALIYQAKGLDKAQARDVARKLMADRSKSLDTLAREELGINPQELGGSAWVAAGISFALFAAGALVPLLPFLAAGGTRGVWGSLGLSAAGLFVIGAGVSLVTGRSFWLSGLRQLLFGLCAAGVTYGLGRLIASTLIF